MDRDKAFDLIISAINHYMRDIHEKMVDHPALGYGHIYDELAEAKKYLMENLK